LRTIIASTSSSRPIGRAAAATGAAGWGTDAVLEKPGATPDEPIAAGAVVDAAAPASDGDALTAVGAGAVALASPVPVTGAGCATGPTIGAGTAAASEVGATC
jgi:hypothetical protein